MNSSSSSISAQGGTSARMRSIAWVVLSCDAGQQPEGGLERFDHGLVEAAARQPDAVGAEDLDFGLVAGQRVRHHVLFDDAVRPDERVPADAAELVHAGERADVRPVVDDDVAGEPDAVAENHVVADANVVRHVRVGHQEAVAADAGDQAAALRCRDGS